MKKIGLLSDTHGYIDDRIISYLSDCDEIWHAGDVGAENVVDTLAAIKPLRAVYGNIDDARMRRILPEILQFEVENSKVFITHIAGYPGHYNRAAMEAIRTYKPHFVVCGHSHILKVMYDKPLNHMHLNPGAAGIHGFHAVRTLLRFSIDQGKILNAEVVELGKRGTGSNRMG
jgi:putative phosphoesterase